MSDMHDRVLALAGLAQALRQVRRVAEAVGRSMAPAAALAEAA